MVYSKSPGSSVTSGCRQMLQASDTTLMPKAVFRWDKKTVTHLS
jgi:hypothetical protein